MVCCVVGVQQYCRGPGGEVNSPDPIVVDGWLTPTRPDRRVVFFGGKQVIFGDYGACGRGNGPQMHVHDGSTAQGVHLEPATNRQHKQHKINMRGFNENRLNIFNDDNSKSNNKR